MIIGIVGKKGSGKTTIAKIAELKGFIPLAFADALKLTTSKVFNIDLHYLNDNYAKDNMQITIELTEQQIEKFLWELSLSYKPIHPDTIVDAAARYDGPAIVYTPRQLLQVLGTDLVRNFVSDQYWLDALQSKITNLSQNYIIHDVRFQNECDFVIDALKGAIIIVERPGLETTDSHVSEMLNPTNYTVKLTNDTSLNEFSNLVTNTLTSLAK